MEQFIKKGIKLNDKYKQKINELQDEIKKWKHAQETPVECTILNTTKTTNTSKDISKNENKASA